MVHPAVVAVRRGEDRGAVFAFVCCNEWMDAMSDRTNFAGTSPFEPIIGFSRAVRVGDVIYVSGTGPVGADDGTPAEQTEAVLKLIETVLAKAGAP